MKIKFTFILLLLLVLSACAPTVTQSSSPSSMPSSAEMDNSVPKNKTPGTKQPLYLISGLRNDVSWGCSAEKGFYSLLGRNDGAVNIRYFDYESRKEMILCGRPECMHNSESCTGWIAPGNGGVLPFTDNKYLYLAFWGNVYGIDGGVSPKIIRRDLNGQNEIALISFSSSETILRPFFSDNTYLYFLKKGYQLTTDAPQGAYELVQLNLETGAATILQKWEEPHILSLMGASAEGNLIVRDICQENGDEDGSSTNLTYTFSSVDPYTGEMEIVEKWQTIEEILNRENGRMLDGKYYYYDDENHTVMQHDFEKGKTTAVLADTPELLKGGDGACFDCLVDGKLYIQNGVDFYSAVSIKDGTLTEITLSYTEENKEKPVRIVDTAGEYYLVVTGTEKTVIHGFDYDGMPIEFTSFEDTLSLISKQDFLSNRASYTPLERYN